MRNKSKNCALILAALLVAGGNTYADSLTDELTKISSENALLKAKLKQLEIQLQIATVNAQINKLSGDNKSRVVVSSGTPIVQAIEGVATNLQASIITSNGNHLDIKAGDTLPDGTTVISISPGEVTFKLQNKKIEKVRVDSNARLASTAALNNPKLMLPSAVPSFSPTPSPFQPVIPTSIPLGQPITAPRVEK